MAFFEEVRNNFGDKEAWRGLQEDTLALLHGMALIYNKLEEVKQKLDRQ